MAQHDAVIDNQAGAAFRADLNNFLAAIISDNSGATAPATTYAYMFWADTTTGLLKQRNAANSAWITIGTLASTNLGLLALSGGSMTGLLTLAAGANIASAATVDLTAATGNSPRITGVVATSAVTMNTGQWCLVVADGAWPLTYNATTNKISGSASYTLTAGDMVLYHKDLSGIVHGFIIKADGTAVAAVATQAQQEAGTDILAPVTAGRQQYHKSAAKAFINFREAGGMITRESYNISSVTNNAAGNNTINLSVGFSGASYSWSCQSMSGDASAYYTTGFDAATVSATAFKMYTFTGGSVVLVAAAYNNAQFFGDQ